MAYTVLLVDDNSVTLSLNRSVFEREGYHVLCADDGLSALSMAAQRPDCIVLDVLLPDVNGFELAAQLRQFCNAPIIFLTSCNEDADIVKGLNAGDDYMSKPYNFVELATRVKNQIRRHEHRGNILDFKPLVIHCDGRSAAISGKPLPLTTKEFDILLALAERRNTPVSTLDLYRLVWNDEAAFTPHVVMVNISTLKKKIERACGITYIVSKRGQGYTFVDPPQQSVDEADA